MKPWLVNNSHMQQASSQWWSKHMDMWFGARQVQTPEQAADLWCEWLTGWVNAGTKNRDAVIADAAIMSEAWWHWTYPYFNPDPRMMTQPRPNWPQMNTATQQQIVDDIRELLQVSTNIQTYHLLPAPADGSTLHDALVHQRPL